MMRVKFVQSAAWMGALGLCWVMASGAQAADVSIQPGAGDAVVVRDSAGATELLRIEGDGSRVILGGDVNYKLQVQQRGRVLVGTGDYSAGVTGSLQVNGITGGFGDSGIRIQNSTANTGWSFYPSNSGDLIIGTTGNRGQFDGVTGVYSTLSDERTKTAIRPLESVMGRVMGLQLARYRYKSSPANGTDSIGVTAQNLQQAFPELVSVNTTDEGNPTDSQQLMVNYSGLGVVALRALQEQQQQIQALQAELQALKAQLGAPR